MGPKTASEIISDMLETKKTEITGEIKTAIANLAELELDRPSETSFNTIFKNDTDKVAQIDREKEAIQKEIKEIEETIKILEKKGVEFTEDDKGKIKEKQTKELAALSKENSLERETIRILSENITENLRKLGEATKKQIELLNAKTEAEAEAKEKNENSKPFNALRNKVSSAIKELNQTKDNTSKAGRAGEILKKRNESNEKTKSIDKKEQARNIENIQTIIANQKKRKMKNSKGKKNT